MLTWGAGMHPEVWHFTLKSGQKLDNSVHVVYIY